jgi:L-ascorbate metabolism protein UlaG (beta-lactamase superfamily)
VTDPAIPQPPGPPEDQPTSSRETTAVTFLGHASFLIESADGTVLTDPVFSDRIGRIFTKRTRPCRFDPGSLSGVAGVLISHAHHDHLDYRSMDRIRPPPPVVAPWGLASSLRRHGFREIHELEPWASTRVGDWQVMAVPSRHFGGRLPLVGTSGHVGYVLSGPSCIYFAGDTGYDEAIFQKIGRKFELDLALLPIAGAVFPWYRRNHMNAVEALQAFQCLGARRMIPMHFGTFPASFEPRERPLHQLRAEADRLGISRQVQILGEGDRLQVSGSEKSAADSLEENVRPDARIAA